MTELRTARTPGATVLSTRAANGLAVCAFTLLAGCLHRTIPRPSLTGCGGLFTTVDLPRVSTAQQRALEDSVPRLTARELDLHLRRSYYELLHDEGGDPVAEPAEAFARRMVSREQAPLGLLVGIVPESLDAATQPTQEQRRGLERAIAHAQAPLARRLERVSARLASAAGRTDVICQLDARMGLNAGAEIGFGSSRILVGPSLVLLAGSEDALAFVIGHELAHIVYHHTRRKAAQELLVRMVTFGYGTGVAGEAVGGTLSNGVMPAFNRDKECEADYYALEYVQAAGYRAEATLSFWKLILGLRPTTSRQKVPFVSGRPPDAERMLRLARWLQVDVQRDTVTDRIPGVRSPGEMGAGDVRGLDVRDAVEPFG